MSDLHSEPTRDEFRSESPIRAFSTWQVSGRYALGKGFRPSLAHLVTYLDAMETKENWQLVQVLESDTQTPSFLFRSVRKTYTYSMREVPYDNAAIEKAISEWASGDLGEVHDPVMPELRARMDQRDYGDEDPEVTSDLYKEMADRLYAVHDSGKAAEPEAPPGPIPEAVYYDPHLDSFYSLQDRSRMSMEFLVKWHARRDEFPGYHRLDDRGNGLAI